jgi:hypothetical protein
MQGFATNARPRRWASAALALGLVAATVPAAPAAAVPTVYALDTGAQGLSFLYTFSGSTVDPLVNGAVPYARSTMTSTSSPAGLSTLLYPGTLGLIYQDALGLAFSSYPEFHPLGQELGYLAPKYPFVARADGRERNSNVGAPEVSNSENTSRYAGLRQQCLVTDDDASVTCSALALDVHVPVADFDGGSSAQSFGTVFDAWRTGLVAAVRAAAPPALRTVRPEQTAERETFAAVKSMKATSEATVQNTPAVSRSTVDMEDVFLLGGALHFEAVRQTYESVSDGVKAESKATTTLVGATLGEVPIVVDAEGVRFADNEVVSAKQMAEANKQLGTALKDAGLTIRVAQHEVKDNGAEGAVKGDGVFLSANLNNQSTVYTIAGWLASGGAATERGPDEADSEGLGNTEGGTVAVSAPAAPEEPALPGATRTRSLPAQATAVPAPAPAAVAAPAPAEGPQFTLAANQRAQTVPASGGGRDPNDYDRETVLALFAIVQFLAIATVAAWGLKVTRAARAG